MPPRKQDAPAEPEKQAATERAAPPQPPQTTGDPRAEGARAGDRPPQTTDPAGRGQADGGPDINPFATPGDVESLIAALQEKDAEIDRLREQLGEMRRQSADPVSRPKSKVPGSCINCGGATGRIELVLVKQRGKPDTTAFRCPDCKHEWTEAEEDAPFRRPAP